MTEDQRATLKSIWNLCSMLGSANDAADHGYEEQAERMWSEGVARVGAILEQEAWLHRELPKLVEELRSSGLCSYRWHTAQEIIEASLGGEPR